MTTLILLCVLLLPLPMFADELPTLAVVDFTSAVRHTALVRIFPDLLSEKLVNEDLFDIVEREKLNTAVTELGLSGSGLVSQDKAISALARAIRRSRAGMKNPNRPVGSFLFLGPTGVGKTTTIAKLAANFRLRDRHKVGLITVDTYRMAAVDRSLLRLGATEILYWRWIPDEVSIDEYVELAKKFGSEEASGFVNAVLDRIAREARTAGADS